MSLQTVSTFFIVIWEISKSFKYSLSKEHLIAGVAKPLPGSKDMPARLFHEPFDFFIIKLYSEHLISKWKYTQNGIAFDMVWSNYSVNRFVKG